MLFIQESIASGANVLSGYCIVSAPTGDALVRIVTDIDGHVCRAGYRVERIEATAYVDWGELLERQNCKACRRSIKTLLVKVLRHVG